MYKAIKEIGGYSVGDEVPDIEAEIWLGMYLEPHVEKIEEATVIPDVDSEPLEEDQSTYLDNMNEDYMGRNQNVVKKNLLRDNLSKKQLRALLKIEEEDKRRPLVIKTIHQKLDEES